MPRVESAGHLLAVAGFDLPICEGAYLNFPTANWPAG